MFKSLFKKKSEPKQNDQQKQQSASPQVNQEQLWQELEENVKKLETENDKDVQIKLLDKIGDKHYQLKQIDEAIETWNKSAGLMGKPGYAHTRLLQAYNFLQTKAWKSGDTEAGEYYADMIDKLMKQNKDTIRYGK